MIQIILFIRKTLSELCSASVPRRPRTKFGDITVLALLLLLSIQTANAQQKTKTYKPNSSVGKDALISEYSSGSNYGTYTQMIAQYWTSGGSPVIHRSLISFPFSDIDAGSIIDSANIILY